MIISDKVKFQSEFIDPCLCNSWVAVAVGGSALIGAGASAYGASQGADAQRDAANQAAQIQKEQYEQTRKDLAPYRDIGADAGSRLTGRLSELTTGISVNPQDFIGSDYYNFLQTQGQKATQNSAAYRGLGKAGAALKGSMAFQKGLDSQEWQNNFNMQNINQSNAFNRLKGLVDTGAGAATGTGVLGEKAAYNQGTAIVGAGNAEAAADNRIGSAIAGGANNIGGYAAYKGMYGGGPAVASSNPNPTYANGGQA